MQARYITSEPPYDETDQPVLFMTESVAEKIECNELIAQQERRRAKVAAEKKFVRIPTEGRKGSKPAEHPNSYTKGPQSAAASAIQRELWGKRVEEVTTPILTKPQLSAVLRKIRTSIREAQGAGWPEMELTLTPGVYNTASKEFGFTLGHDAAMTTLSETVHHSASAMVRHVVHETVKSLGWLWRVSEHVREPHSAWPTTKGIMSPQSALAQVIYDRDFEESSLLRDVLSGGESASKQRGMEMHRPIGVSPALRALQVEAMLLLESYEKAVAEAEEASARLKEARMVADENALFTPLTISTSHYDTQTGRDTLRDVQWWNNRCDESKHEKRRLEASMTTLREEALTAARAAILLGDWSDDTCNQA